MFYLDDVQADWLESVSVDLINLHMEEKTPMIFGVIPNNLDNPNVGGGYLPNLLKRMNENESDLFEIGQHGYTHADLKGKSYEEQKEIIQKGLVALTSIGIKPVTFIPPFGSADVTTIKAAEDLDLKIFLDLYEDLHSDKLLIMNSWVSLTVENERAARYNFVYRTTTLKQPQQIIAGVDQETSKKGNTVVIVVYYIHDLEIDTKNKLVELSKTLKILKNSGKYRFMTARQYRETLREETIPTQSDVTPTWSAHWILYLLVGASATTTLGLLASRRLRGTKSVRS
jgi:hypothetical protein